MDEANPLPDHGILGRKDCFHDGCKVLGCVKNVLPWVNEDGRKSDTLTPQIVNLMLQSVLVDDDPRFSARQLRHKIRSILHAAGNPTAVSPRYQWMTPVTPISTYSPTSLSPEPIKSSPYHAPGSPQRMPTVNGNRIIGSPDISQQEVSPLEELPSPNLSYPSSNNGGVVPTGPRVTTTRLGTQPLSSGHPLTIPEHTPNRESITGLRPLRNIPAIEKSFAPDQPPKASSSTAPGHDVRTSLPPVTFEELQQWIVDRKQGNKKGLPGWESAKRLLDGRDFVSIPSNFRFNA